MEIRSFLKTWNPQPAMINPSRIPNVFPWEFHHPPRAVTEVKLRSRLLPTKLASSESPRHIWTHFWDPKKNIENSWKSPTILTSPKHHSVSPGSKTGKSSSSTCPMAVSHGFVIAWSDNVMKICVFRVCGPVPAKLKVPLGKRRGATAWATASSGMLGDHFSFSSRASPFVKM